MSSERLMNEFLRKREPSKRKKQFRFVLHAWRKKRSDCNSKKFHDIQEQKFAKFQENQVKCLAFKVTVAGVSFHLQVQAKSTFFGSSIQLATVEGE